jgi:hypothetical protein
MLERTDELAPSLKQRYGHTLTLMPKATKRA